MCPYVIVHVTRVRRVTDAEHYANSVNGDWPPEDRRTYALCTCGWTAVGRLASVRAWAHRLANT